MTCLYAARPAAVIFLAAYMLPAAALAEVPGVYQDDQRIAASGYDVVAYFTKGQAVKGSPTLTADYAGAIWRFAALKNRDLFRAQPKKYSPQYGGYCAYAVSQGAVATTVPEAWSIVDGKLYLNYSLDVRTRWEAGKNRYISKANANWPGVLK